jgi:hypothetical protein
MPLFARKRFSAHHGRVRIVLSSSCRKSESQWHDGRRTDRGHHGRAPGGGGVVVASRETPQGPLIGIGCPNEDHSPAVCFHVDRMRWQPTESADKMRCRLGGFIKSVYNTSPRGGSDGNGPDQPLLRKLTASHNAPPAAPDECTTAPRWRSSACSAPRSALQLYIEKETRHACPIPELISVLPQSSENGRQSRTSALARRSSLHDHRRRSRRVHPEVCVAARIAASFV